MVGRSTTHRIVGCSVRNDRSSSSSCMYSCDADLNRENTPVVPTTTSCCTALAPTRGRSCGKNMIPATCTTVSHPSTASCHGPASSRFPEITVNFSCVSGNRLGDLLRTETCLTSPSSSRERRANNPTVEVAPIIKQFIEPPSLCASSPIRQTSVTCVASAGWRAVCCQCHREFNALSQLHSIVVKVPVDTGTPI